jgi:hypothetical protein
MKICVIGTFEERKDYEIVTLTTAAPQSKLEYLLDLIP